MVLNINDYLPFRDGSVLFYYNNICPILYESGHYLAYFLRFGDKKVNPYEIKYQDRLGFENIMSTVSFRYVNGVLFAYIVTDEEFSNFSSLAYTQHFSQIGKYYFNGSHGGVPYMSSDDAIDFLLSLYFENPDSISYYDNTISTVISGRLYNPDPNNVYSVITTRYFRVIGFCPLYCCFPDFKPIIKVLGGKVSYDQLLNLKTICQLLGVDTNTVLKDCDAMKEYLSRLNLILGGFSYVQPNDNFRSICDLLGVDSNANGLTDCALSKDYVKRNSIMLGAE